MIMNQMNQTIIDAFHFRHATKEFDPTKKISDEDFNTILETGRLSPSSLGLEPWHFVVVQNKELREKLKAYSWGAQKQLDTASHFVLIFDFQESFHIADNERTLYDWASKQTYIALANMMTSAALLGINSCPIEGFDLDKVTEILSDEGVLDTEQFGISVMVGFGYRAQEPKHGKVRQNEDDIISWIE